jgi:hypothetical protein
VAVAELAATGVSSPAEPNARVALVKTNANARPKRSTAPMQNVIRETDERGVIVVLPVA